MGLKQSIVVKSEFTVKNNSSKGGSRGGSPGAYVTRYMARNGATETCTPVKLFEIDDYMRRYMARDSATEPLPSLDYVKPKIKNIEKYGGVAFGRHNGRDDVSLSDEELKDLSKDIQNCFDEGKTVMKTILSFDEEYLKETGIIEPNFKCESRGDYRGNIDQMKLRLAIMHGLDRMGSEYDNLNYAGVIQVDTTHVHCHLAMVDKGRGNLVTLEDGSTQQKGKISERAMSKARRGIDAFLDEEHEIAFMKSSVDYDRHNTMMFVRRAAYKTMRDNGFGQFLLACLPEDQRLWRARTNNKAMKKADVIAREYVKACFARPESGYLRVLDKITAYADLRRDKEGLGHDEYAKLIKNGERKIEDDCVNGVYNSLRTINKAAKQIRTPMLDVMSIPIEEIDGKDDLSVFAYHLRSYSSRIAHANQERDKATEIVKDYEKARDSGVNVAPSVPVYEFFKFEAEYQEKLLSKYRHFLTFIPPADKYSKDYEDLLSYRQQVTDLNNMYNDTSIRKYTSQNSAEEYGERIYHQRGGKYMTFAPEIIETRRNAALETLGKKYDALSYKLVRDGLLLEQDESENENIIGGIPRIRRGIKHNFQNVKALDLHHLGYDNPMDIKISRVNLDNFLEVTAQRATLLEQARLYLEDTSDEQSANVLERLPIKDVEYMEKIAKQLAPLEEPVLPSLSEQARKDTPRSKTVKLDYSVEINKAVDSALDDFDTEMGLI